MYNYNEQFTPSIMWVAPICLHDTSSGAAMQVKLSFEEFAKRGINCSVLGAFTFDAASGTSYLNNLMANHKVSDGIWVNTAENNVAYSYLKTSSISLNEMTRREESIFLSMLKNVIREKKPDVICLYGSSAIELAIITIAKQHGIKTCFSINNGHYLNFDFSFIDRVLADSHETVKYYKDKINVNMLATGTFIDVKKHIVQNKMQRKFISFVNPSPEKGVSILMRLALMAKEKQKDWEFLVVESRGTWKQAINAFNLDPTLFTNVNVTNHVLDMRLVYEQTKLLLVPSIYHESFGRVAVEATFNAIPVLATNSGGLVEAVNGGGKCINAPEDCVKNYMYLPSDNDVLEWFEALEEMLDEKNYDAWCKKAKEAGEAYSLDKNIDKALSYLRPLFEARASQATSFYNTFNGF